MVVHRVKNGEDPEEEDMYDATIHNDEEIETRQETGDEVKDDAHDDIVAEDKFFDENQNKLDRNSGMVDLDLLENYKCTQLLGERHRVINMHWKKLTNKEVHYKLQEAIKLVISKT